MRIQSILNQLGWEVPVKSVGPLWVLFFPVFEVGVKTFFVDSVNSGSDIFFLEARIGVPGFIDASFELLYDFRRMNKSNCLHITIIEVT